MVFYTLDKPHPVGLITSAVLQHDAEIIAQQSLLDTISAVCGWDQIPSCGIMTESCGTDRIENLENLHPS